MATATQLEKSAPAAANHGLADGTSLVWTRARLWWASMAPAQRAWMAVSAVLLAGLAGGILWLLLRTDWRTLYANLDAEDARQVGNTLTQAQIPFDVSADGGLIRVPAAPLDKARLATAAQGAVR